VTTLNEILAGARDAMTVSRVFGEPIDKDGVTVIPVAHIAGGWGGGGGAGPGPNGEPAEGFGGGFGVYAWPSGVYVIKGGDVTWQPVTNPQRAIIAAQAVAIAALVTWRVVARTRRKGRDRA
jgi:uncharacterized spore protein YtfJ